LQGFAVGAIRRYPRKGQQKANFHFID